MSYISEFNIFEDSMEKFIEFLQENWQMDEWLFFYENGVLELCTGGFKNNIDVIKELENTMFWSMFFVEINESVYKFKIQEKYLER